MVSSLEASVTPRMAASVGWRHLPQCTPQLPCGLSGEATRLGDAVAWGEAMEDAYLAGKCKAIGVSNFSESHLRKLLDWDQLRVRPSVHQTELHPYLQQKGVVALCEKEGILLQAYASLGGQDTRDGHWKALKGFPRLSKALKSCLTRWPKKRANRKFLFK